MADIWAIAGLALASAFTGTTCAALTGFGSGIIFLTFFYIAQGFGFPIGDVQLTSLCYINMISAVYIIVIQNPRLYIKQWKLILLIGIPCVIGSVTGVQTLNLISENAEALSYVKTTLAIIFLLLGMYFITSMSISGIGDYIQRDETNLNEKEERMKEGGSEGRKDDECERRVEEGGQGHEATEGENQTGRDTVTIVVHDNQAIARSRTISNTTVTATAPSSSSGNDHDVHEEGNEILSKEREDVEGDWTSLPWLMEHSVPLSDIQFAVILVVAALISGFMGGLTSIKGPPFIILFGFAKVPPKAIPIFMLPTFTLTSTSIFVTAAAEGLFDWNIWPAYVAIVLGCVGGMGLGVFLRSHVEATPLKVVLYSIVIFAGLKTTKSLTTFSLPSLGSIVLLFFLSWILGLILYTGWYCIPVYWSRRQRKRNARQEEDEGEGDGENNDHVGSRRVVVVDGTTTSHV